MVSGPLGLPKALCRLVASSLASCPICGVFVLCTSRYQARTQMAISVTKNMWFVVIHDGCMPPRTSGGKIELLWRFLEEANQTKVRRR
jgi:hypothetical protein